MDNTAKQAGQSAKDLAQKIAKQMAQEPLEVLKDVREQVAPQEISPQNPQQGQNNENQNKALMDRQKTQDKMKSGRRMEALNRELSDIHKQDLFKDLQAKISQGVEIPLEDYPELSMEQKQVLKAQMEAVRMSRRQDNRVSSRQEVPSIHSKPSRRFGAGQKQEAEKQQTRVEKPVPPSG